MLRFCAAGRKNATSAAAESDNRRLRLPGRGVGEVAGGCGRESTMDPVLENVLVELLVDLPGGGPGRSPAEFSANLSDAPPRGEHVDHVKLDFRIEDR